MVHKIIALTIFFSTMSLWISTSYAFCPYWVSYSYCDKQGNKISSIRIDIVGNPQGSPPCKTTKAPEQAWESRDKNKQIAYMIATKGAYDFFGKWYYNDYASCQGDQKLCKENKPGYETGSGTKYREPNCKTSMNLYPTVNQAALQHQSTPHFKSIT